MRYTKWQKFKMVREGSGEMPNEPDYEKDHSHGVKDENEAGGLNPENAEEEERYKKADLITLPPEVPGTNCSNCSAYKQLHEGLGFCEDSHVKMYVTPRMCCKFWDNDGVKRSWGEMKV